MTTRLSPQQFTAAAIARQRAVCEATGVPRFAPADGHCYSCRRQIYVEGMRDGSRLVTGCPWCARSYCE